MYTYFRIHISYVVQMVLSSYKTCKWNMAAAMATRRTQVAGAGRGAPLKCQAIIGHSGPAQSTGTLAIGLSEAIVCCWP